MEREPLDDGGRRTASGRAATAADVATDGHPIDVRRAHPEDAAALARLHRESQRVTYGPLLPAGALVRPGGPDELGVRARWRLEVTAADHAVVVACRPDRGIVGVGVLRVDRPPDALVRRLHVAAEHQARGIGSRLLDELSRIAAARGHGRLRLHVLAVNRRARDFYEHRGWRLVGALPGGVGADRIDAVVYEIEADAVPPAPV